MKAIQKQNSPGGGEDGTGDIKLVEAMLKEFKASTLRKVEKLRQEMIEGFIKNDCDKLQAKIVERINDTTIALTKELADRIDTRKNFRLIERQLRNIFNMAL